MLIRNPRVVTDGPPAGPAPAPPGLTLRLLAGELLAGDEDAALIPLNRILRGFRGETELGGIEAPPAAGGADAGAEAITGPLPATGGIIRGLTRLTGEDDGNETRGEG